jgi:SAM-dependent methyltransferase
MTTEEERERLAATFDAAADRYHRARPAYPDELIERVVATTSVRAGDRVLEVGCATGKATIPFARRGLHVTCIESGPALVEIARRNTVGLPVTVKRGRFEDWDAARDGRGFDLVFAATAWHWIDPAVRYQRAYDVLRTGGHLAFWSASHVLPDDADPFFAEIQEVYEEIGEAVPTGTPLPRPENMADLRGELEASGLFDVVAVTRFVWARDYDAESYIDLLETFSGHIAMQPWQRERLYGEIRRRLGRRPDARVHRHWGALLHVARRRG